MQFTGNNLLRVRNALGWAISDLRNEIATCPDVFQYEAELDDIEDEIEQLEKLIKRVDRAIAKEGIPKG